MALVLTINRASLLNRPCQTMQCPAESRDEDMSLQWSLAVPTSYQWQRASILAAFTSGPCQAWLQWGGKKAKDSAAGIKQRLDYPLNMCLSKTIPLWVPCGSERKKRHHFSSWLLQSQSILFSFTVSSSHSSLVCRLSVLFSFYMVQNTPFNVNVVCGTSENVLCDIYSLTPAEIQQ